MGPEGNEGISEEERRLRELEPTPKSQSEEPSTYVQSPEVAQEMAEAEIDPREQVENAVIAELPEEEIKKVTSEIDKVSEMRMVEYEKAMKHADDMLVKLLQNPGSSMGFGDISEDSQEYRDLVSALTYRTKEFGKDGQDPTFKSFKLRGEPKNIRIVKTQNSPASPKKPQLMFTDPEKVEATN